MAGTPGRLRADSGGTQVVLAGHLLGAADLAVLDADAPAAVEPFGLLATLPSEAVADVTRWREHLVEVETGLPPNPAPGAPPRPDYDPAVTTLVERQRAKAAELGVGLRTVERKRGRYLEQVVLRAVGRVPVPDVEFRSGVRVGAGEVG
ncbi:hypothetical protein AB0G02_24560 [Actinosynnema sp. NPDC023658]|uniref:hypothetical protein n=1 Tax=Actinosynnema sp. NPDC023658 TaxID=3155465 RepID=UPI0033DA29A7